MQKQIVFVHGGETFPTYEEYLYWLENESVFDPERADRRAKRWHRQLETLIPGSVVLRPQMPNDLNAQYREWELYFQKVIPHLTDGVICIGHSLGGTFFLKYLAAHTLPVRAHSVHLVAPSFGVPRTTFTVDEDISNITQQAPCTIYHSKDDPVVPYRESVDGVLRIPNARLISCANSGHFLSETLPELTETLLDL